MHILTEPHRANAHTEHTELLSVLHVYAHCTVFCAPAIQSDIFLLSVGFFCVAINHLQPGWLAWPGLVAQRTTHNRMLLAKCIVCIVCNCIVCLCLIILYASCGVHAVNWFFAKSIKKRRSRSEPRRDVVSDAAAVGLLMPKKPTILLWQNQHWACIGCAFCLGYFMIFE